MHAHLAARAIGVARAAFDDALAYAQERQTFGKPIWQHQSVGNLLADMATAITAAQQLNLLAARQVDAGRRADMEAGMAKLFASEAAYRCADRVVQVFGGRGYMREFPAERYLRELRVDRIWEGTSEIQRMVIARALEKRGVGAVVGGPETGAGG